jgi:hypothetical protein
MASDMLTNVERSRWFALESGTGQLSANFILVSREQRHVESSQDQRFELDGA